MTSAAPPVFSVVNPVYGTEDSVAVLKFILPRFKIILADNRSRDGSWAHIQGQAAREHRVWGLRRNSGHHQASTAGLDLCRGEGWSWIMTCNPNQKDAAHATGSRHYQGQPVGSLGSPAAFLFTKPRTLSRAQAGYCPGPTLL